MKERTSCLHEPSWLSSLACAHIARDAVQEYANSKGVDIIGDMPIYVGGQSADVWANRDLFELGPEGSPEQVRAHTCTPSSHVCPSEHVWSCSSRSQAG